MHTAREDMISTVEANSFISGNCLPLKSVNISLDKAGGLILARDIYARVDIPSFPQSGMDGYALAYESLGRPIALAGEQAAGSNSHRQVPEGTAIRIFTGAMVPEGADTVVIQEKTKIVNGFLQVEDDHLKKGDNVRMPGSEIAKGSLALPAGSLLSPPAIGFLAGMGTDVVEVVPNPRVSIIVTGSELQDPGTVPEPGRVYESNSFALKAALRQSHIDDVTVYRSADEPVKLEQILGEALNTSDLVLMTGGVSVGDYDFTVRVSEQCGVQKIFHRVRQKPGKPLYFGIKGNVPFFGLPGNPASVLTCFYEYVTTALEKLTGRQLKLLIRQASIACSYTKPAGLTHFLKGIFNGQNVELPQGQESYKLNSFARANCLVVIPEPFTGVVAGENVEIHLLPDTRL